MLEIPESQICIEIEIYVSVFQENSSSAELFKKVFFTKLQRYNMFL